MASENRTAATLLAALLEHDAIGFDYFAALRLIEAANPDKPRLGRGIKAADDAVRIGQAPELQFSASTLAAYSNDKNGVPRLAVNFFGLFGPNGPLPLHLTEYARERLRNHRDPTLSRFADVFHHRMLALFYRAWADARPAVSFDRPEADRFAFYIGALMGIAGTSNRNRDALADRAKLYYVGRFAQQVKSPDGLQAIIAHLLSVTVRIEEFVVEWMAIPVREHTRLGLIPLTASLGQSTVLGASVWGCQHKFRIFIGPMSLDKYLALLPGGTALAQLEAIVRNYIGDELVWDVNLILQSAQVPAELALGKPKSQDSTTLGENARLGWSMWLGPRAVDKGDADDLLLNPFIRLSAV